MSNKTSNFNPDSFENVDFFGEGMPDIFKNMFGATPNQSPKTKEEEQKEEELKKLKAIFGSDFYEIADNYEKKHKKKD